MIEYIEKNILRQLFLCGQFYVNKEVNLEKALQSPACLQNHFAQMISIT